MIKAIIIDDEPLARAVVKEYLEAHKNILVVQECGDGFEGAKAIPEHKPDIIFLDVQMPKITGFEMLELVDNPPDVIFTTAFDEYAIKAFDAHAVDYLLKPFSQERFNRAIEKWLASKNKNEQMPEQQQTLINEQPEAQCRIVVKTGGGIKIIPLKEIIYIEAYDDYVKVHTHEGMFLKKKTMSFYEKTFDAAQFLRIHRSYLIQLSYISKIELMGKDSHVVVLKGGVRLPASRSGYKSLKEMLGN